MADELPDLDEDVSFVVDDGTPVGPMTMRQIIVSIRNGQRNPKALVWWADATEWVIFQEHKGLAALLSGLPAGDQPPPPPPMTEVELPSRDELPPIGDDESQSVSVFDLEPVVFEQPEDVVVEAAEREEVVEDVELEPIAEEIESELDDEVVETLAEEAEPDTATTLAEHDDRFSGLFGATARAESGLSSHRKQPRVTPETLDEARTALENVGARIDALSAATRESSLAAALAGSGLAADNASGGGGGAWTAVDPRRDEVLDADVDADNDDSDEASAGEDITSDDSDVRDVLNESAETDADEATVDDNSSEAGDDEVLDDPAAVAEPGSDDGGPEVEATQASSLDQRFEEMVRSSEELQRRLEWTSRVDEILLSACITAIADRGFMAAELASRDTDHRVAFDTSDDSRRVLLEIVPLGMTNAAGDSVGRHVRVGLSWGRGVDDIAEAFSISRSLTSDDEKAGIITTSVDASSETAYTAVDLVWAADDFVSQDYAVDKAALESSIAAALHALERRWHEIFGAA